MTTTRKPGERAGLTPEIVFAAARELLAEVGIEAMSMRGVAKRLGVAPNALYAHVVSKQDLVDHLLDDVLSAVDTQVATQDPSSALQALMVDTYDVLLLHAALLPAFLVRQGARGDNARRLGDGVKTHLESASVPAERVDQAVHVLIIHTIGFAAFASHPNIDSNGYEQPPAVLRRDFTVGLKWLIFGMLDC
ncbi:helix-turn-helix domain-containing protein [Rhodococcus sp. H29-C3]|uniref:TetR/AcrR family transcriptional regulator n=1 Tax=Rhodococcus sp. H29-C3 TaxID=3046307 RepID=UPI0024BACD5C|nr:helix-turn-helix domain-containing protein [Rhodococcus sp. H29-C3]MDJ0363485.1 helix-turn-helix domain-containing protein [Rhodococcus sp. H29-C3]